MAEERHSATVTPVSGAQHGDAQRSLSQLADELAELVERHAVEGEQLGALVEEVDEAFHDSGLWGMWLPATLGGAELHPLASIEVIERVSRADASTGWVLMAGALATGVDAAYLGSEAVEDLYGGERLRVHAGQGSRPGRAVRVDGGFVVSGEWSFASGIKHAQVVHSGVMVEGTHEWRTCAVPIDQVTLVENWDVLGLRATGSIDYTMDGVLVPESFTYLADTEIPLRGGNLYTLGLANISMIGHTAWALGVGRRMLDELGELVRSRRGRPGSLAESDAFLGELAMAEAKYRGARALVLETWGEIEETLQRGERISFDQHTRIRLALQHTTWTVEEVSLFVYTAAGTTALRAGTLQRFFRDMHAGAQHVTSSPPLRQACGQVIAGLASDKRWVFGMLMDAGH